VLQAVARVLLENSRKGDALARIGGDEFAVIAPRVSAARAPALVSKFSKAVNGLTLRWQDRLTIRSVPISGMRAISPTTRRDGLLFQAGRSLYHCKRSAAASYGNA
jgi:diguanylate cyclase (GGDEF)-like protein